MRKLIPVGLLIALATGCSCGPAQSSSTDTGNIIGINALPPAGSPVPEIGVPVTIRIVNSSGQDADVTVRYTVGPIEVRLTSLHITAGTTPPQIGPDLASLVEIRGTFTSSGNPTPPKNLLQGTDFQGGDTITYEITCGRCGCGVPEPDTDADGTPDCIDLCPTDPAKVALGTCGCNVADTDTDGDGILDCVDGCSTDPNKTEPGTCGCNVAETDTDHDGTPDCIDLCPTDPAKTAPGACGCNNIETPNCTPCPDGKQPGICGCDRTDTDGDATLDCVDLCPTDPAKTAPGRCGCNETETDTDEDGTPDCVDTCPTDPNKIVPGSCGCNVVDDADHDGVPDCNDCNHNHKLDSEDIAAGTSRDCDGNGTPDECQLTQNLPGDCNANGVPDATEIANNPDLDCNSNGRLDFCDLELSGPPTVPPTEFKTGTAARAIGTTSPQMLEVSGTLTLQISPPHGTTPVRRFYSVFAHVYLDPLTGVPGVPVTFTVISGPNEGYVDVAYTDESGQAVFVYSGTGDEGTDMIQASISLFEVELTSNTVTNTWGGSADCNNNCIPDECEVQSDSDRDGVPNECDNCPDLYNPDQRDRDSDGIGDACDSCAAVFNPIQGPCPG